MDHQKCLKIMFLKTTILHFDSSNTKVFLSLCGERWQKFHFITLNQFQTMEAKRSWDCVQKPLHSTLLLTTIFLIGFGFIPSSPHSAPAMLWPEKDSFPPMVLKIQLCLGWDGGGVTSLTNITGKVPTLLTSTVGVADRCNH